MELSWRLGLALACAPVMLSAEEVWAAGTPSWEEVQPMITARVRHTATLMHDGRVLVVGGIRGQVPWGRRSTSAMSRSTIRRLSLGVELLDGSGLGQPACRGRLLP